MKVKGLIKTATTTALPIIGGAVAANFVQNMAGKFIKNEKLRAASPLILGLILAGSKKTEKIGFGMIAVGGSDLVGKFVPSLAGIEDMDLSGIFGDVLTGSSDEMYGQPLHEDVGNNDEYFADDVSGEEGY